MSDADAPTYVPAGQTLSPWAPFRSRTRETPFPWSAPAARYGLQARNLLYRLLGRLGIGSGDVVLAPEYHNGNEIRAIRATGATVQFYPIGMDLQPDLAFLADGISARPRALLLIHYFGWPQPLTPVLELCRRYRVTVIEDCAHALLSEPNGIPLGSSGDYGLFCLYKTLAVPDGAMLVTCDPESAPLPAPVTRSGGVPALAGRTLELCVEHLASKAPRAGAVVAAMKRRAGRMMRASGVRHVTVGDIGFDRERVDLDASAVTRALALRCDFAAVRERRRRNFARLAALLRDRAAFLDLELDPGVCPLLFPLLVSDKHAAASYLAARGVMTCELWNEGADGAAAVESPACSFLRRHILELPIHQDVTDAQLEYMAREVIAMNAEKRIAGASISGALSAREAS